MPIRIVTDSASDLPQRYVDRHAIAIVPLTIRFGAEELVDREELDVEEFWRRLRAADELPETSAPSAGRFEEAFRAMVDDGADGIVCINLSSRLSATMQAAQVAARAIGDACRIEVIDSRTVSMAQGNLCIAAAALAEAGASIDEIVADVLDRRDRTRIVGTLETLEYARKGGRIGIAQALVGTVLSIKPILEIREGVVAEAGKVRTRARALRTVVERLAAQPVAHVAAYHGDAKDFDEFLAMLDEVVPREQVITGLIGPVIGTHTGPGTIAVGFQELPAT